MNGDNFESFPKAFYVCGLKSGISIDATTSERKNEKVIEIRWLYIFLTHELKDTHC